MEGALLRLRPKVMTVSTVVAGLLPIMWSNQVGAEVMKPLATPVLGGMVSSLIHVLIVTPVIFFWIKQRQLGLTDEPPSAETARPPLKWRPALIGVAVFAIVAGGVWALTNSFSGRGASGGEDSSGTVVQSIRSGDLDVILRSETGSLRQGRNTFTIEFRSTNGGALVDVGPVRASASMVMPGMVMPSGMEVHPTGVAGRYEGTAEFGMAGTWPIAIEWNGPAGRGSVSIEGAVQ